jgi:hypothetical protein
VAPSITRPAVMRPLLTVCLLLALLFACQCREAHANWININFTICRSDYSQSFAISNVQAHVWPPPLGQDLPLQVNGKALLQPSDDATYQIASGSGIEGGHLCMLAQCPIAGPFSLDADIGIPASNSSSYHSFELSATDDSESVLLFCVRVEWTA